MAGVVGEAGTARDFMAGALGDAAGLVQLRISWLGVLGMLGCWHG